jgi:SLT domain-containing protein
MHTMAELSEGNKAEVILPVENKNRTLDLMAQVLSAYGPGKLTGEANTSSDQTTKYQLSVLELLQKIVDSNGKDVFIDGQKITDYISQRLSFNATRKKAF